MVCLCTGKKQAANVLVPFVDNLGWRLLSFYWLQRLDLTGMAGGPNSSHQLGLTEGRNL